MRVRDLDALVVGNIGVDTNVYLPPATRSESARAPSPTIAT